MNLVTKSPRHNAGKRKLRTRLVVFSVHHWHLFTQQAPVARQRGHTADRYHRGQECFTRWNYGVSESRAYVRSDYIRWLPETSPEITVCFTHRYQPPFCWEITPPLLAPVFYFTHRYQPPFCWEITPPPPPPPRFELALVAL
eukprot:gene5-biopygen41